MLSIQSLIQNAKQLSKSYEKNAMNAEGVIQQMANFAGATAPPEQNKSSANSGRTNEKPSSVSSSAPPPPPANATAVITDPKVMIASLLEQEQQSAIAAQKSSAAATSAAAAAAAASTSASTTSGLLVPGSISTCKPRSLVMAALQRESPRVKALKRENHLLKQQLQEYQFALELIMSKYRGQMMALLAQAEACAATILAHHESPERMEQQAATIALTNRLQEMKGRFERSIGPSSEERILAQRQLLHELVVEHETLLELYQISKRYGSLPGATPPLDATANLVSTTEALMEALKVVELASSASATVFSAVVEHSSSAGAAAVGGGEAENTDEGTALPLPTFMEAEEADEAETEKENLNPELLESPMDVGTSHLEEGGTRLVSTAATAVAVESV